MEKKIPQFMLVAPTSGSGKTTVSRGLMALLSRSGMKVQPFKCGPDYIDTKYHAAVCGRPSVNLDSFMGTEAHVRSLYARHAAQADACVVEGMMGMFDGYSRDRGSSAEIAHILGIPVVLVVDAKSAAYSMAPLLAGFLHFRPEVEVLGVIFNRVGSARHFEMLQEVCSDLQVTCFGYLPKEKLLEQDSRYLGLDFSQAVKTEAMDRLLELLEAHVEWRKLLYMSERSCPTTGEAETEVPVAAGKEGMHVVVARNEESFSFVYEEHLEVLRRLGRVTLFDPETNDELPADTDLLYLPGGYPEKHAEALAKAERTMASICAYAEAGGRVLAECGGMIYLSAGIRFDVGPEGRQLFVRQVGLLPFCISDEKAHRHLSLGYRQFVYQGRRLTGHEFHYTQLSYPEGMDPLPSVAQVYDAKGREVATPVFRYKNVIASYTHLYWGGLNPMSLFD